MTSDEHGRSIIDTPFMYDRHIYEARGYGVFESGPVVDGKLMIEDIEIEHRGAVVTDYCTSGCIEAAHDALVAQYWRDAETEKERE